MEERGLGVAVRLEPVGCPAMEHGGRARARSRPARARADPETAGGSGTPRRAGRVERGAGAYGRARQARARSPSAPARRRRPARSGARAPTCAGERSAGRASAARGTRSGSTRPGTDRRLPGPRLGTRRLRVTRARPGGCPAAQPSHRSSRSAASSAVSPASSPRRSASPSRRLSASSPACSSSSLPSARSRAIGNVGVSRPTSASADPSGNCSASVENAFVELRERSRWALSTTSTKSPIERSRDASRASSAVHSFRRRAAGLPAWRSSRSRAAASWPSRSGRVVVASSTDSQANGLRSRSAHCAASVVFPYPAGAVRVTRDADAVRRRFTSGVARHRPGRRGRHANLCFDDVRRLGSRSAGARARHAREYGRSVDPRTRAGAPLFPVGWHQCSRDGACATLRSG